MNKKIMIPIIAIVVIVVIAIVACFMMKKPQESSVNINLQELNTTILGKSPFNEMSTMEIDSEVLTSLYEITPEQYDEFIGRMPLMNVQASMYLVIKAKDGSVDAVKEKLEIYAQNQEESWSRYLPEQYELVKQRKLGVKGNYVYLIISENAAEIEELINK